jgi:uncharacterized protein
MHPSTRSLILLLRSLKPVLQPGTYVFCQLPLDADLSGLPAIATFRESAGLTVILEENAALARGLEPRFRAAWITLTVYSDLDAVGLTAAVARALADRGISCNVVAAVDHDHLFVPVAAAGDALDALVLLSKTAIFRENAGC